MATWISGRISGRVCALNLFKQDTSCWSVNSFDFSLEKLQSREKSNELTDQQDMFYYIHNGYKIIAAFIFAHPFRRPYYIPGVLHHSVCGDEKKRALFATQGAADWQTFLLHRSRELVPGQNKNIHQICVKLNRGKSHLSKFTSSDLKYFLMFCTKQPFMVQNYRWNQCYGETRSNEICVWDFPKCNHILCFCVRSKCCQISSACNNHIRCEIRTFCAIQLT